MARNLILQNLMQLAKNIGANQNKFMGTRSNISFLGKGPTKNPLFQGPLQGLESASEARLGPRDTIISTVEDAMGYASAGKLNDIQLKALTINLESLNKIYNPPPLPMASISPIRSGIRTLRSNDIGAGPRRYNELTGLNQPRAVDLPQKTASARATMIRLLDVHAGGQPGVGVTLREIMTHKSPQDLKWLMEGGGGAAGDPIALFRKYFGEAAARQLPTDATPTVITSFARRLMQAKDNMGRKIDDPFFSPEDITFAGGGLAEILQVPRSGYAKGRAVKSLMGLVNKKLGKGTLKRATEVDRPIYAQTFDDIESFRGKIDDNIIKEIYAMDPPQQLKAIESVKEYLLNMKNLRQGQMLEGFDVTGRLSNASGGLARILEV